ncbi:hypothetical protein MVEN_02182600 [Mycena venus]|uniref:Uncharacterized protein n=1 Tax=Mycena venus TaxID=2733690 RepID=A0A8H7CHB5_9AGAR|nr:hypothetical protein MVEN_02182600 [Mycena venus]
MAAGTPHDLHLLPSGSGPGDSDEDADGWQTVEAGRDWWLDLMEQVGSLNMLQPESLYNLAASFTDQYRRSGDVTNLEAALQKNQEALALIPTDHPHRAYILQALAESFTDRYRRFGDLEDLEAAVQKFEEVVALTPAGLET